MLKREKVLVKATDQGEMATEGNQCTHFFQNIAQWKKNKSVGKSLVNGDNKPTINALCDLEDFLCSIEGRNDGLSITGEENVRLMRPINLNKVKEVVFKFDRNHTRG